MSEETDIALLKVAVKRLEEREAKVRETLEALCAWRQATQFTAGKIMGFVLGVTAFGTLLVFGAEKAFNKLIGALIP